MVKKPEKLLKTIIELREIKQCSVQDCAALLNKSTEAYLKCEQGERSFNLPEIELLSIFLGVPIPALFEENLDNQVRLHFLEQSHHPRYKLLRQKWIQSKIRNLMAEKSISLQQLHGYSGIPTEHLDDYLNTTEQIPLNHLYDICDALDIPFVTFLIKETYEQDLSESQDHATDWQSEFPEEDDELSIETDVYAPIIRALKSLPVPDQADVMKKLLGILKSKS